MLIAAFVALFPDAFIKWASVGFRREDQVSAGKVLIVRFLAVLVFIGIALEFPWRTLGL